ncbi:DgyrCDS7063 [Dimorphilus gyrociliatus]|uniref:DgyrCDS7063 n=1 Tax=Dimorphilus gyrociliatus TaxID=2664684 RepID=A0A7I8VQ37_9ANNE|nr:DgyrCDS7063 [Dimorphilus gyrociliatus]
MRTLLNNNHFPAMFRFLTFLLIFVLKTEIVKCINCFACDWYADYTTGDARCGWDNEFTIPQNQSDVSVGTNCEKCALGILRKDDRVNEIVRRCITDLGNEEWEKEANYCSHEPLVGGHREFCYCENDYCNKDNSNIANVCDTTTTTNNLQIEEVNRNKEATTVKCYQCFWKKGQTSGPFNPKCGYGDNFTIPAEDAIENCDSCFIRRIMKGDDIQEINRGCSPFTEDWQAHKVSCATQPLTGGRDEFCYCKEDLCNDNVDDIPSTCDSYIQETTARASEYTIHLRNPDLFSSILDYYRSGELHFSHCLCGSSIKAELLFWKIEEHCIASCCYNAYKDWDKEQETLKILDKTLSHSEKGSYTPQEKFSFRHRLWRFLEKPNSSAAARLWAVFYFIMILVSIAIVCMETVPKFRTLRSGSIPDVANETNPKKRMLIATDSHPALLYTDGSCIILFFFELVIRFSVCPNKKRFFVSVMNIIDILSVFPMMGLFVWRRFFSLKTNTYVALLAYLFVASVLRVFRLLKMARHHKGLKLLQLALKKSAEELVLLFLLIFMGMLVFSTLLYFFEFEDDKSEVTSIPIGFWWCIITMTTVGYGDIVPNTSQGYLIGALCAICGILATGLPIPIIASNFNHFHNYMRIRNILLERQQRRKDAGVMDNFQLKFHKRRSVITELSENYVMENVQKSNWCCLFKKNIFDRSSSSSVSPCTTTAGVSQASIINTTLYNDIKSNDSETIKSNQNINESSNLDIKR